MENINRKDLTPVIALWFNKETRTLIIECENGFQYEWAGQYNHLCCGVTDHRFTEVEITNRANKIDTDVLLPFALPEESVSEKLKKIWQQETPPTF